MARGDEDQILEPILPKHPPTEGENGPRDAGPVEVEAPPAGRAGLSWERPVLVACAVIATIALVVLAARAGTVVQEERRQSCYQRAFLEGDRDDIRDAMDACDGEDSDPDEV